MARKFACLLAAVLSCAAVWIVFDELLFTHPNFAEHSVSILSGIAAGTVVHAALRGKFRSGGEEDEPEEI
jgi:hypothetical protein